MDSLNCFGCLKDGFVARCICLVAISVACSGIWLESAPWFSVLLTCESNEEGTSCPNDERIKDSVLVIIASSLRFKLLSGGIDDSMCGLLVDKIASDCI